MGEEEVGIGLKENETKVLRREAGTKRMIIKSKKEKMIGALS